MKVQAIVYTSMTGYTAQYATLLSKKTGLPVYTLQEAVKKIPPKMPVLFMSWLMAGTLVDYKKAKKSMNIVACCAVGLNATGEQAQATRKNTGIADSVLLFPLPGGYNPNKLKGPYKWAMKMVTGILIKKISAKEDKSEEDESMLYTLQHGGSFVHEENLTAVLSYLA